MPKDKQGWCHKLKSGSTDNLQAKRAKKIDLLYAEMSPWI